MIDLRHPLAVLATRMPWASIEATLAPMFERRAREGLVLEGVDMFGATAVLAGSGPSAAGRPRLPIRLMVGLLYLKHFKCLRRDLKRQRTVVGRVLRDIERKMSELPHAQQTSLQVWLERAWRICRQRPKDKNKLYALHAPEAECIGKGKARQPYEFGVKVSLAITERQELIVGARAFPGNPYDGHVLAEQLEQTSILLQDAQGEPRVKTVLTDLGYRGVDADVAPVQLVHRGKSKTLSNKQRRWLKRRQAIEPIIGHVKHEHGMRRCWLKGKTGDAVHAVLCATGYNVRWLLRAIARLGVIALFALAVLLVAFEFTNGKSRALASPSP